MTVQSQIVKDKFNRIWKSDDCAYLELTRKMEDERYFINEPEHDNATINMIHRAVMCNRNIIGKYPKGSTVIDAACGNGFNTCFLNNEGYRCLGFDVSEVAIERAKALAGRLKINRDIFFVNDHSFFKNYKDNSVEVVLALGLMRYLLKDVRDDIYKEVFRILKPGGSLIVSNDNFLFELFCFNDQGIKHWTQLIEEFSSVAKLTPNGSVYELFKKAISFPQRKYSERSVSKHIQRHVENPLTFGEEMKVFGYCLTKNLYPDCHLLPPALMELVELQKVDRLRAEVCLSRAEGNWRAMFMDDEFLSVLEKK